VPVADPAAAEDAREERAMQRFLAILEKNPRRGTALDRVYAFHVERGSLDAFIKSFQDRTAKNPGDGTAWMILGLLEFQRGQDAAAVAALKQAEITRSDDPLAPYYLGQALVLVGQPEAAAAAFERALQRKPARNDLLDIFQSLGRVYQRTQKGDQALQVWNRLDTLFPNDPRVQEQIASALAEENQPALALPRFETLAKKVADPFRQVQLAMQAADLKIRLGRTDDALRDFETLLGKLRPDSWLHREVRRKIEEVFLRNDDQPGLVAYYERWTKNEPEDVEALVRLGRTLASMGRAAEAQTWYEKAVKLAPSRRELRLALISQLAGEQKFAEAAAQYQALDQSDPNNPDTLRDWGALLLRDTTKPQAERKAAAAAVWRKLHAAKPNDPVTAAQVADLLRQADLVDQALALYRHAAELAPSNPQYHEYIGEYLHNLKRPQEALTAWGRIAQGENRNAKNLARLAEVYAGFGYLKEALPPLTEAVALDGDNFDLRLKLAELSFRLGQFDAAETQLAAARKLAEKDEEKSAVLEARVKNDQAAERLAMRIDSMEKALAGNPKPTAEAWSELARYFEADAKLPEAVRAADRAIAADPRSIAAWTLAARVRESAGNLADSADALRRLGEIDRRNRTEHLTGVARLEARLGRIDAALKAGRDLLAAAPGNPEHYEFFAQLCFQLGKAEEGLDALRRAVRVNPNDTKITLTLAETLAGQYRTEEAIEMYWRAFEKAEDLDAKLGAVSRLTELYLQRNQLDRLLVRLQHQERDARPGAGQPPQRDVSICTAQAYAASGDLGSARLELERLLASNTPDTQLLQQLSKLAEEEGDLESAARYQKQLLELAPNDDGSSRLAQLYSRYGELEEAQAVWSKMASGKSEAYRIFGAIDSLLGNRKPQPVLEITESMIRKEPTDWEALYRQGVALLELNKPEDAARRFQALLDLTKADDEKSATAKARSRDPKLQAAGARPSSVNRQSSVPLEDRIGQVGQIRMACKLEGREVYSRSGPQPAWGPPDFGQARMAALGWLVNLAQKQGPAQADELLARVRKAVEKTPADPRAIWDWFYLCALRHDNAGVFEAGRHLARAAPTDPLALWAYLYSLGGRRTGMGQQYYVYQGEEQPKDRTPPLEKDELEHVLSCYRSLRTRRPELAEAQILQHVSAELARAKRVEEEERFYRETIAGSTQFAQIAGAFGLAARRGDVDGLLELFDRFERLQAGRTNPYYYTGSFYFNGPGLSLAQGMAVRADQKAYDDVLKILDHELLALRRKVERQSPGAVRAARARQGRLNNIPNYQVWVGRSSRYLAIAFPVPNEYLDTTAIQLLRTAFELFKRDDMTSDLVTHYRKQADAAKAPADAIFPRLALAAILWWNDERDDAVAELAKVAENSKVESELRLDLAELREQQGERAEALALADLVQPFDNTTMRRREEIALRLSVQTGNLERAQQAAERLFGLRLDTETQVSLAGQMSQLGLHELAEAVLGRARRRAGNKATALLGLMLQYQRQGKLDVAVQIAMQVLRSTTATRQTNPRYYYPEDPDASRAAAVGVLARSGKLPQLIERANEQLKKTPSSVQAHQALADYYKASGQREKARAELGRIVELRPDDSSLRIQVAAQLMQEGQAAAAIEHYKAILKKDPALLANNFYQVQNAFQQVRKLDELVGLLEQIDLRQFGQSYYVYNLISNLFYDETIKNRAMPLLKKAWDAFPQDRSYMLNYLRRDELWQLPDMYEYMHELIIPKKATFAPVNQWNAFGQMLASRADGRMNAPVSRFLDQAAGQGKLDELAAEVESVRNEVPDWTAGNVLGAILDCRRGRYDQVESRIRQFLDQSKDEYLSTYVYWCIGEELENHARLRDLAVTAYESALNRPSDDPYSRLNFDSGPAKRLVTLYERESRLEDARRVLVDFAKFDDFSYSYDVDYQQQMRMRGLGSAANKLNELGFHADAIALYGESLAIASQIAPNGPNFFGNREGIVRGFREGLTKALDELKPDELAASLTRRLKEEETRVAKAKGSLASARSEKKKESRKAHDQEQLLDLVVMVHPRELDKAQVRSLLADAVAAPAKENESPIQGGSRSGPRGIEQLATVIEAVRIKHPNDLSVAIANALFVLASGEPQRIEPALVRLVELIDQNPLEPLAEGARANARQRAEAARQVPLWLVARACWNQKVSPKPSGAADTLAARALEAARRQIDNATLMAMYREQGESALARGDRKAAEAAWGRMLEIVLEPPGRKTKKPAANAGPARVGQPQAKPSPPPPSTERTSMAPLSTRERDAVAAASLRPLWGRVRAGVLKGRRQSSGYGSRSHLVSLRSAAQWRISPPSQGGEIPLDGAVRRRILRVSSQDQPGAPLAPSKTASTKARRAAPGAKAAAVQRANLPIVTLERFEQAMQIARLAAEHDLADLSFRAVRESLQAGPPIIPVETNPSSRVIMRSARGLDDGPVDQVAPRVIAAISELERLWQKHRVSADGVYRVLCDAVLPPGRPTEVFLYASPLNQFALRHPQSLGRLLAEWAVRAGKANDVKGQLAARRANPLAELPAAVLLGQLAVTAGDSAAAVAAFGALRDRLKRDASRATGELVCHVAIPALDRPQPEVAAAALEALAASIKSFESSTLGEPLGSILLLLARRQFKKGDHDGGRKRLDAFLEAMERNTVRYGGDYGVYVRKQQLQRVAAEFARAGLWTDALAALGRFVDTPAYSGGDPPVDQALVSLLRHLKSSPAQERYETLRAWTMPEKDRRIVRILTSMAAHDMPPEVFTRLDPSALKREAGPGTSADEEVVSTATALIESARDAGALDQLAQAARAAAEPKGDQKIENGEVFAILVDLALGRGSDLAPRIDGRIAEVAKENENHARTLAQQQASGTQVQSARVVRNVPLKFPWSDYLVAHGAIRSSSAAIGDLGARLIAALAERAQQLNDWGVLARLRCDLAEAAARRTGTTLALAAIEPPHWTPANMRAAYDASGFRVPTYWVAQSGLIAHPSGSTSDLLMFNYPLTGTYEVSFLAYVSPSSGSVLAHNGLAILPSADGGSARVNPLGECEIINIPWRLSSAQGFNRLTVQASPQKTRYLVNGHLLYEDNDPSPGSPWLGLLTFRERHSAWRDLTIKGSPVIPREVRLTHADRLEGWISSYFGETQPPRRTEERSDEWGNVIRVAGGATAIRTLSRTTQRVSISKGRRRPVKIDDYDWAARDGVIHGRRVFGSGSNSNYVRAVDSSDSATEADQSRLYYHRPLGDGDVLTYEFLYQPGQVMVHPAVDRLAFLIEPEGVKLHWITTGGTDLSGLPADNVADELENRRGPTSLPLKPGEWNAIRLALEKSKLTIDLNGRPIYERQLEPRLGRQFGLFHYKDQTSAQVRNVVLRGRWPEALPPELRGTLVVDSGTSNDAMRAARHAAIDESIFALEAGEVVARARGLTPASAYEFLAKWVVPSPEHPLLRLEGEFSPSFPALQPVAWNEAASAGERRARAQAGGELRAPVIDLVDAARAANKLDDLAARVEGAKHFPGSDHDVFERSKLAVLGLIAIARGDDAAAARAIDSINPLLGQLALDAPAWKRWPELCLATRALSRPALRKPALAVVDRMIEQVDKRKPTQDESRARSETWMRQVKHLRARFELLQAAEDGDRAAGRPFGNDSALRSWARVTQTRSQTRGEGYPVAHWTEGENRLTHYRGHDRDFLYLTIPLRGEFQIDCELSARPGQAIRLAYGGLAVGPKADGKLLDRSQFGRPLGDVAVNPPLEKLGEWLAFRLAVQGGRQTISINGRKVHESAAPPGGDPWVTILSQGMEACSVRNFAITGSPSIPVKLDLAAAPDLAGWLADEYLESSSGDNADWDKLGEEITGRLRDDAPGSKQESLLVYHRPILEDGRITYEFYHDPGKVMVHPALGRTAFLLEPDGVKVHWLTDGAYERSGLSSDNTADEADSRRGAGSIPLRPKAWNRLELTVTGDRLALRLNDQPIEERAIESVNQRSFGLFHYADATAVRVRNVTYEGRWPRSLPMSLRRDAR
jgi:tetratricopeptide (TPR) repeat protein